MSGRGRRTYHRQVTFPVQVGPASITINRDDRFLVCQPDGRILGGIDDGFFTRDTRLISGYDLRINGHRPLLLNSAPIQFFSARFEYSNEPFLDDVGPVHRQTPCRSGLTGQSTRASTRTSTSSTTPAARCG